MSPNAQTAPAPPRLGRPPSGARERILEAATEVLKADGYAGLTIAKVAARAGESKALIGYHFGSKDGLVSAVGEQLAEMITTRVLEKIRGAQTVEEVVRGIATSVDRITEEDERIPRLYFDLAAVSVVEPEVRTTITRVNEQWRGVIADLLTGANDAPPKASVRALTLLITAGVQGLALERIERGRARELSAAREMFISAVVAAAS